MLARALNERVKVATDEKLMAKTLSLANKGRGYVSPNPMVGAIVVLEGEVVGKGYHARFGEPHAEVVALANAGNKARTATLYVNLEPCSHHGKTPPCVDAIVDAGISKVVAGMRDPNPEVNGKGFASLSKRGVEVKVGIFEQDCRRLNEAYVKHITTGMPFITLKMAQSLDGRIATSTGHSKWITCDDAREYARDLRAKHDAVLVGAGTVRADDPLLTLHGTKGPAPRRIVLDDTLSIPLDSKLLTDEHSPRTIIVTTPDASPEKVKRVEERGAKVVMIGADEEGMIPIASIWKTLGEMGIASILVEGGKQVFTSALEDGSVDRLIAFVAPKILGEGISAVGDLGIKNVNQALQITDISVKKVGSTFVFVGQLSKTP